MTEVEFNALAKQGYNRIALVTECLADLDTPLSVYMKLANRPDSFLLESVEAGKRYSRYSFIGLPSHTKITCHIRPEGVVTEVLTDGKCVERQDGGDPLAFIESFMGRWQVAMRPGLPRFTGGLVGCLGYDTVRLIEPEKLGKAKPDDIGVPDIELLFCEELVVVDNLAGRLYLILNVDPSAPEAFARARRRMKELKAKLSQPVEGTYCGGGVTHECERPFAKADYLKAVGKAKEYIAAGDLMQVQVGQRIERTFTENPLTLYRALRTLNPSPYEYFYNFGDHYVVGASPEILVRVENREAKRVMAIRPIAGTRKRSADPVIDDALRTELQNDPKERAEHLMLIDLARNDIGRIAEIGTVKVTEKFIVERYSEVQHLVSHVEGVLPQDVTDLDVLRAAFPAGTLTGAPKIRAMELIDELEPVKRGLYGGSVGYIAFGGDMDMAIAIRTAVIKGKRLYTQAAAGIVADSVPENEWKETEAKMRAVLKAADEAELGLEGDI